MSGTQMKAQIDKPLTNALTAYIPQDYISEMILPKVGHAQWSGKLNKITNTWLRIQNTLIGGEGAARRDDVIDRTTGSFEIESHGLTGVVSQRDKDNWEKPFDAEKEEAMALSSLIWLGKEKSLADSLGSTSVMTSNVTLSGTAQFNDYSNSDPLDKFKTAQQTVEDSTGMAPTVAVMNAKVKRTLMYHPALIEFIRGQVNPGMMLTDDELAKAMQVDRILVGRVKYNSAAEGQTASLSNVWGNNITFLVAPPSPQLYQVSFGYHIFKNGEAPRQVFKQRLFNPPNATEILVTDHYDFFIADASAGYLIKDAVA